MRFNRSKLNEQKWFLLLVILSVLTHLFMSCGGSGKKPPDSTETPESGYVHRSGATIKVLIVFSPEGATCLTKGCSGTLDLSDPSVVETLEVTAANHIDILNSDLVSSGVTHNVVLADGVPDDDSRYVTVLSTSQHEMLELARTDPVYKKEDYRCNVSERLSPTRDQKGIDYSAHWWPCVAHGWMYGSQKKGEEIGLLRAASQADIIVMLSSGFDKYAPNHNSSDPDMAPISEGACKAKASDGYLSGDEYCVSTYGNGHYCILDGENGWGGGAPISRDNTLYDGKCYDRFSSGGGANHITKGLYHSEAEKPFIALKYNHGAVPHEIGHLLGLEHDMYKSETETNPGYVSRGYVDPSVTDVPSSSYGGLRDKMSYNSGCDGNCYQVPILANPHVNYTYFDETYKSVPMGHATNGFAACTFEEMGFYASNFFEHSSLGDPTSYITQERELSECIVPESIISDVYRVCQGGVFSTDEEISALNGCSVIDGDLVIENSITLLDGMVTNGVVYHAFRSIRSVLGDLTFNINNAAGTNSSYLLSQGYTTSSNKLNLPNLREVRGNVDINISSASKISHISLQNLLDVQSISISSFSDLLENISFFWLNNIKGSLELSGIGIPQLNENFAPHLILIKDSLKISHTSKLTALSAGGFNGFRLLESASSINLYNNINLVDCRLPSFNSTSAVVVDLGSPNTNHSACEPP